MCINECKDDVTQSSLHPVCISRSKGDITQNSLYCVCGPVAQCQTNRPGAWLRDLNQDNPDTGFKISARTRVGLSCDAMGRESAWPRKHALFLGSEVKGRQQPRAPPHGHLPERWWLAHQL